MAFAISSSSLFCEYQRLSKDVVSVSDPFLRVLYRLSKSSLYPRRVSARKSASALARCLSTAVTSWTLMPTFFIAAMRLSKVRFISSVACLSAVVFLYPSVIEDTYLRIASADFFCTVAKSDLLNTPLAAFIAAVRSAKCLLIPTRLLSASETVSYCFARSDTCLRKTSADFFCAASISTVENVSDEAFIAAITSSKCVPISLIDCSISLIESY